MKIGSESSHINHIGAVVLVFIIGGAVGYRVGAAYESANLNESLYEQTFFYGLKKTKVKAATTSASDLTADWLTYKSDTNNFSFKYPKDHFVSVNPTTQTVTIASAEGSFTKDTQPKGYKKVWISYNSADSGAAKEKSVSAARDTNPNIALYSSSSATTDGNKGTIYETTGLDKIKMVDAFITSGTDRYYASAASGVGTDVYDAQLILLKRVISTFKFSK